MASDQQSQRRENRQNVRRQLGAGHAEKHKDENRPDQQHFAWLKPAITEAAEIASAAAVFAQATKQTLYQHADPRNDAQHQNGNEVIPRAGAAVDLGGEALKVFVNEEKLRELRIFHRHQYKPGRGDGKKQ